MGKTRNRDDGQENIKKKKSPYSSTTVSRLLLRELQEQPSSIINARSEKRERVEESCQGPSHSQKKIKSKQFE